MILILLSPITLLTYNITNHIIKGKGRSFRVGDQKSLAQYLSQVCQLNLETLEDENERKLRLILSKAQQHQRQLQEQICSGNASPANNASPGSISAQNSPSSSRKKTSSKLQSPRGMQI